MGGRRRSVTKFNPGDIVKLNSGGAKMSVKYTVDVHGASATGKEIGVHCYWHSLDGKSQKAVYNEEQLVLISERLPVRKDFDFAATKPNASGGY